MFGFHEIREIKQEERNLCGNGYNPDARIVVNTTTSNQSNDTNGQWNPDERITVSI